MKIGGDPIEGHDVLDYEQAVIFDGAFVAGVDNVGFEVLLGVVAAVEDVSEVERSGGGGGGGSLD